ncbi:MAG: amidohydrolase family protein [Archangium sp.]|nr:amidohydrolase family protein [Archangium sp.]MDP3153912.1 amidohydrolase family protein [Archangium sp.]MDP3575098.1 amidohydrolase family protein [Archangium sp.]
MHAHFVQGDELASFAEGAPRLAQLPALDAAAGVTHSALIVIAKRGDVEGTRVQNDAVIAFARKSGGHFFAVCSVHPMDGEAAVAELERVAALGVKVVKLHPNTQRFDVGAPEVAALIAATAQQKLVVLFDGFSPFDANQTGKFLMLAVQNPEARMILAHAGGPKFDEFVQFGMLRPFPWYQRNVWVDLSATAHFFADSPYEDQLVWLARQIGVDRVLFGSDFPIDSPAHAAEDFRRLGFTAEEEQRIFHDNAVELLGLDAAAH